MASGAPSRAAEPALGSGEGAWHSTCSFPACDEPSRYAADFTCKGCRRIKYCTFACQKADWKRHKSACKADAAADEAAAREGALVEVPRARVPPPKPELLLDAVIAGDLKLVEALLRLGADVNSPGALSFTLLYVASQHGHTAIVAALLAAPGIAINAVTDKAEFTPLHIASFMGHAGVVSLLLEHPSVSVSPRMAGVWDGTQSGATPLRLARSRGHHGVAAVLEARGGVV